MVLLFFHVCVLNNCLVFLQDHVLGLDGSLETVVVFIQFHLLHLNYILQLHLRLHQLVLNLQFLLNLFYRIHNLGRLLALPSLTQNLRIHGLNAL